MAAELVARARARRGAEALTTYVLVGAALFALLLLSNVVAELRKAAFGIAVIATCYTVWLRGQPEYEADANALMQTMGIADSTTTDREKDGAN